MKALILEPSTKGCWGCYFARGWNCETVKAQQTECGEEMQWHKVELVESDEPSTQGQLYAIRRPG